MNSRIFWIASDKLNSLAIMARPRAGEWLEDEVANYKREGIDIVISLLESHEVTELELHQECRVCEAAGITFLAFPIADRGTPLSMIDTKRFIEQVHAYATQHKKIAIHCRAGIGRSSPDGRNTAFTFWARYRFGFQGHFRFQGRKCA